MAACSLAALWSSPRLLSVWLAGCARCSGSAACLGWPSSNTPSCVCCIYSICQRLCRDLQSTQRNGYFRKQCSIKKEKGDIKADITFLWNKGCDWCEIHQGVIVRVEAVVQLYQACLWALSHAMVTGHQDVDVTPKISPLQLWNQQPNVVVDLIAWKQKA